jgi:hypothetical protein
VRIDVMKGRWLSEELERFDAVDELHIAPRRSDGTFGRPLPIWVVRVGDCVYVRTWYRRGGWFRDALRSGLARISVPGVQAEVRVEDVGCASADLRADVDGAYRRKYARYGSASVEKMVSDLAAETTLRLMREQLL